MGVHPMAVTTEIRVRRAETWTLDLACVAAQMEDVWGTAPPDAVKAGSLGGPGCLDLLADRLTQEPPPVVVDPELVDRYGRRCASDALVTGFRQRLFPQATVACLNLHELALITGRSCVGRDALRDTLRALFDLGVAFPLAKASALDSHAVDLLYDGQGFVEFGADKVESDRDVGAGAILSAAITAALGRGCGVLEAVSMAKELVISAIDGAVVVAGGKGPACPVAQIYRLAGKLLAVLPVEADGGPEKGS